MTKFLSLALSFLCYVVPVSEIPSHRLSVSAMPRCRLAALHVLRVSHTPDTTCHRLPVPLLSHLTTLTHTHMPLPSCHRLPMPLLSHLMATHSHTHATTFLSPPTRATSLSPDGHSHTHTHMPPPVTAYPCHFSLT